MMSASLRAIVPRSAAPPPVRNETPAELAAPAGADSGYYSGGESNHTRPGTGRQRLPAYGRQLKAALDHGYRPIKGGGTIIVTSDWNYARYFDGGRVVCPPADSPDEYDFAFLNGCEVVVLVHERDEPHGRALLTRIREAGPKLAVLSVNREVETC